MWNWIKSWFRPASADFVPPGQDKKRSSSTKKKTKTK